jgi:hypothetical protein
VLFDLNSCTHARMPAGGVSRAPIAPSPPAFATAIDRLTGHAPAIGASMMGTWRPYFAERHGAVQRLRTCVRHLVNGSIGVALTSHMFNMARGPAIAVRANVAVQTDERSTRRELWRWELDIGPGRQQAHSAKQKRLLTRQRNRLHDRHRAPLGAGGFE